MTYSFLPISIFICPDATNVSPVMIPAEWTLTRISLGFSIVGVGTSRTSYLAGLQYVGATSERIIGGMSVIAIMSFTTM